MSSRLMMCVAAAAAMSAVPAQVFGGSVLLSNLAEPVRATTDVGNNPNPTPPPSGALEWSWVAQSFTTDAQTYSLTRIDMIAGDISGAPVVVAELRSDAGGAIGALITTLDVPDLTGAPSVRTFTPTSPVTLSPGTTYWVVLGVEAPGDGVFFVSYAANNDSVGTGTIGAFGDSQDSGGTWNYGTDFPYFIQVVADPAAPSCASDLNGDGLVNSADLAILLGSWGPCPQ